MMKKTKDLDTYFLYLLTFLALLFFMWGITSSFMLSLLLAILIFCSGFIWNIFMNEIVRDRITNKLKMKKLEIITKCPKCSGEAKLSRSILEWNRGIEQIYCNKCDFIEEKIVQINIG